MPGRISGTMANSASGRTSGQTYIMYPATFLSDIRYLARYFSQISCIGVDNLQDIRYLVRYFARYLVSGQIFCQMSGIGADILQDIRYLARYFTRISGFFGISNILPDIRYRGGYKNWYPAFVGSLVMHRGRIFVGQISGLFNIRLMAIFIKSLLTRSVHKQNKISKKKFNPKYYALF